MPNSDKTIAVIFDMDGVIIDSNPLIVRAWEAFFLTHDIKLTPGQLSHIVFGRKSSETIDLAFNKPVSSDEMRAYQQEIDGIVRGLYVTDGAIVPGFKAFVELLIEHNIAVAIATSAPMTNVEVVLDMAGVTQYFGIITDSTQVRYSKPHHEIYLKTATKLGIKPANCCVFEDSYSGIDSARSAGMKVIGVTTTHSQAELVPLTDAIIPDFTSITIEKIKALVEGK